MKLYWTEARKRLGALKQGIKHKRRFQLSDSNLLQNWTQLKEMLACKQYYYLRKFDVSLFWFKPFIQVDAHDVIVRILLDSVVAFVDDQ